MINGNNLYWQNSAMNIRKDEDEWRIAKDTVPAPSELGSKDITENGNYSAKDDGLDGYSDVSVSVSNSYTSEDEGTVNEMMGTNTMKLLYSGDRVPFKII